MASEFLSPSISPKLAQAKKVNFKKDDSTALKILR